MVEVNVAIGIVGLVLTILIFFACSAEKNKDKQMKLFLIILLLNGTIHIADILSWLFDGNKELTIFLYIITTITYMFGYMIEMLFTYYLLIFFKQRSKVSMNVGHVITFFCFLEIVLLIISLHNGIFFFYQNGIYQRGKLFWLSQIYPVAILIVDLILVLKHRKVLKSKELISFLSYIMFPTVALLLKIPFRSVTLTYIAATFAMLIVYLGVYAEQNKRLKESEMELASMRVSIMLSQIQPHFLYNSLSTIQALCTRNPEQARDALGDFSKFLRGNMDSLSSQKPIHFSRELEHVKHYLNLEKIRFRDKMEIKYEIEEDDFFLPALTMQPIVENAVKYGIGNAENGGTIIIRTKAEEKAIKIIIVDNGVGFQADSINDLPIKNDGRSHIGLTNVKSRIQKMVHGDLELYSKENVGTVVTITIPKE